MTSNTKQPQPYGHQPRIVYDQPSSVTDPIIVNNPTVSQAYYGILCPLHPQDFYQINPPENSQSSTFSLQIQLLIPDLQKTCDARHQTDIVVTITNDAGQIVGQLWEPNVADWTSFFEPFGKDYYLQGPMFTQTVPNATYYINVNTPINQQSPCSRHETNNTVKYCLAIGYEELFPPDEIANAAILVPRLKREFFFSNPWICSPLGCSPCPNQTQSQPQTLVRVEAPQSQKLDSTNSIQSQQNATNAAANSNLWWWWIILIVVLVFSVLIAVLLVSMATPTNLGDDGYYSRNSRRPYV